MWRSLSFTTGKERDIANTQLLFSHFHHYRVESMGHQAYSVPMEIVDRGHGEAADNSNTDITMSG